jgi:hypothetical protein
LGCVSFGPAGGQPFEKVAKHIKIKVQSTLSKNLFAPFFKSWSPDALIINSSYYVNHSPSPILHAIPCLFNESGLTLGCGAFIEYNIYFFNHS